MTDMRRTVAATLLPGFEGTTLPEWLRARLVDGLGGVCLFGENVVSAGQLRALTDAILDANPLAVIAIDEEGGDVTRLFASTGSPYPGNAVLGRWNDLEATAAVGREVGRQLRLAGCTVNFAPDVDINSNPDNPVIGVRSFGIDPEAVARHSAAWVTGLQSQGVAASAKHFPGHGDTAQDSHLALPVVDRSLEELWQRELKPFEAAIAAGTRTIMTSHIVLPQLDPQNPATLSRRILQGLLRDELGFEGVIVSDALDMKGASGVTGIPVAAVRALAAGCELLCIGTRNTDAQLGEIEEEILTALGDGRLESQRVEAAAAQVRGLSRALAAQRRDIPIAASADRVEADSHDEAAEDARVIAAFDVQPGAHTWLGRGSARYTVMRMDSVANIAVGAARWGPFAETAQNPDAAASVAFSGQQLLAFAAGDPLDAALAIKTPVLVVGRNNHLHAFVRDAVDALRAAGASVLVVDMGWPSEDRRYADVATFGATRLIGRALLAWLRGDAS
jgi:beta-N-acetylhexosaminidase